MIARQSNVIVESSIQGEAARMGISANGMAYVMSILTDMYSNRILACIREYSTNGRDAQIEAGFPGPIEVTLPNDLAPFLRIKDYGIGLSEDEIRMVYSQYGESTKRASNDFNGMLGIGCKSALTYAAQFTVVSVKDGRRVQVVVSRDAQGGTMTPVSNTDTDDANGTEVIIPVERGDIRRFHDEAATFFAYWDEGTVLVNSKAPTRFEGLKLTDSLYAIEGHESYVVMGGVRYPAEIKHPFKWGYSALAFVPIGAVEFAPSREALMDTPITRATLESLTDEINDALDGSIQNAIDNEATTPYEAIEIAHRWSQMLQNAPTTTYQYNGSPLPWSIKGDFRVVPHHSSVLKRSSCRQTIAANEWNKSIWLYGYDVDKEFSAPKKRKILQWYTNDSGLFDSDNPSYPHQYVLCDAKPDPADAVWLDEGRIFKWDDVAAQKLPRNTISFGGLRGKAITGSFSMWIDGVHHDEVAAEDIDPDHALFYITGMRSYGGGEYARLLFDHYDDGCTVVMMPRNREAKFCRNFPEAKPALTAIRGLYDQWAAKIPVADLQALAIQNSYWLKSDYTALVPVKDQLDDPELVAIIESAGKDLTKLEQQRRVFSSLLGRSPNLSISDDAHLLAERYPLYDDNHMRKPESAEQVVRYINNEYAIRANSDN